MGPSSRFLSQSTLSKPISVIEFANALLSTWQRAGSHPKHAATFGLAVSGGVDSMALAALCSELVYTPYPQQRSILQGDYNLKLRAFVVDHGARKGSDVEAEAVSKVLEARHIPTQLLKIDWAGHEKPAELPNFESLARKYRFQALGKACRDEGINSLLLAHHEDDQAETLMMRLLAGHRMAGLRGMQPVGRIPECHGLHGVHESGEVKDETPEMSFAKGSSFRSMKPLETEYGGVKVYRPLLGFSKDRLIATCQAERMEWFEDHTNKDPTVTRRNAIRHMYKNHSLPLALSKPALLELSTKAQKKRESELKVADSWLPRCHLKFETRTGTVQVRFADLNHHDVDQLEVDVKYAAALLLLRIVGLVSPHEHIDISLLVRSVERIFPECFSDRGPSPPTTAFTVARVHFKTIVFKNQQDETPQKPTWLISRQPFMSKAALPTVDIPANPDRSTSPLWSEWILFDGRFWIRIRNLTTSPIVIRPFHKDDMSGLRDFWSELDRKMLRKLLKDVTPEDIRWTLPALAVKYQDGKERFLALPTLDVGARYVKELVDWEVRYKNAGLEIPTASVG